MFYFKLGRNTEFNKRITSSYYNQIDKPSCCSIFPLGRYYSSEDEQFHYFRANDPEACRSDKVYSLKEWLDLNNIHDYDEASVLWTKLYSCWGSIIPPAENITEETIVMLVFILFGHFDTNAPFVDQVKKDLDDISSVLHLY